MDVRKFRKFRKYYDTLRVTVTVTVTVTNVISVNVTVKSGQKGPKNHVKRRTDGRLFN